MAAIPWRPQGSWWRSWRAVALDVTLALTVTAFDVALTVDIWHLDTEYAWLLLIFQTLADLALVARRRFPLAVLATLGVAGLAQFVPMLVVPGWLWPVLADRVWVVVPLSTPFAAYAVVVYGQRRRLGWVLIGVLTLIAIRPWRPYLGVVAVGLNMTVIPALAGLSVAARRRLVRALAERAERAEREQHLLAAQARADERARLAREMHDVVTHRVSLMVLQAGALRVAAPDPQTRRIAEELRTAGCEALEELRELIGVLRSPSRPGDRGPGDREFGDREFGDGSRNGEPAALPDLSTLAEQSRSLGIPVELVVSGNPLLASPAVGRTAYRVVQEALTNVRKHAPGASVRVDVRYCADRIRLTVTDTGPQHPPSPELAGTGSGSGLYGLRQRVELVSGSLEAGPRSGGGFRVAATLPGYVPTAGRAAVTTATGPVQPRDGGAR